MAHDDAGPNVGSSAALNPRGKTQKINSKILNALSSASLHSNPLNPKVAFFFGFIIWGLMTFFLWRRYRLTFEMDEAEQPLTLFSENAMYYSFYLDTVRAPTWTEAVSSLMRDRRSEHPDVINALQRFNIYPELLLGLCYRCLRSLFGEGISLWFKTPFNFYAACIFCFQGFGVACVCVLAAYVGSSILCGICCFGFFLGNFYHRLILRTDALTLREHWGLPFLWLNLIAIYLMLQRHMRLRDQSKILAPLAIATFSSLGLLLSWQFGVFILTTQVASLFGTCLLGYPISIVLRRIVAFYAFSLCVVFSLMFASKYLALSYFPAVLISVFLSLWFYPRLKIIRKNFLFFLLPFDCWRGGLAVVICMCIRIALLPFEKEDAHVFRLLLHHLGLSGNSFDSSIYSLGHTEFSPLNSTLADYIASSGITFKAIASKNDKTNKVLPTEEREFTNITKKINSEEEREQLEALFANNTKLRRSDNTKETADNKEEDIKEEVNGIDVAAALSPGFCYLFIQGLFFFCLMLLIARLRVLALPLLCVFSSLFVSTSFWLCFFKRLFVLLGVSVPLKGSVKTRLHALFVIILFLLSFLSFFIKPPLGEILTANPALENANSESKQRLFDWMRKNIPPNSAVLGDMTLSASIRASLSSLRIVIHPQYENVGIRKRVQFAYGTAACPPFAEFNQILRDVYKTNFIILNSFRCAAPPNGAISVFDVANKIEEYNFNCPAGVSVEQRFCFRILFDNQNPFFKLLYVNEVFAVLERVELSALSKEKQKILQTQFRYEDFDWKKKIIQKESWEPFLELCRRTDAHCGANICGFGLRMLERHRLKEAATFLHNLAVDNFKDEETAEQAALFLDFNLRDAAAAKEYYRLAAPLRRICFSRSVQFVLYLQQSIGSKDEIIEAAEDVVRAAGELSDSVKSLLKDAEDLCRGAVILRMLSDEEGDDITADQRRKFAETSKYLWLKAKAVNIQGSCVVQHWKLFEAEELNTFKRMLHFFFFTQ